MIERSKKIYCYFRLISVLRKIRNSMAQLTTQTATKFSSVCTSYAITLKHDNQGQVVEMSLGNQDLDSDLWPHDDCCARLGWVATNDALKHLPGDAVARVMDTKLSVFQRGQGKLLLARAEPIFANSESAIIRTQLYRADDKGGLNPANCIGEFTAQARLLAADVVTAENLASDLEDAPAISASAEDKPLTAKEQAMEVRRRKIFDGACEVIGREGYAATTIRKVAKAAGVPISTMYQYIDTKEDLLFMITSSCMEEIFEYMTEELRRDGDAVTKMTHAIDAYVKYISKNRRYINLAYRETRALSRANREKIFDIERRFTRLWEEIIISGNKSADFNAQKSRLAANMIYFFCNVWSLRYWSVQDYTEDEVRAYLMKFIMSGLRGEDAV
jgi:AcrR family transcriptional regulator